MYNIGPTERIIPLSVYKSCSDCVYHKSQLWRSGRDPEYTHNCMHPDSMKQYRGHLGNLNGSAVTPDWCPVLLQAKKQ